MIKKIFLIIAMVVALAMMVAELPAGVKNLNGGDVAPAKQGLPKGVAANLRHHKMVNVPQLRCWQYGKLIFEESGWSDSAVKTSKEVIVFSHNKKNDAKLYLMNVGTSTCLYSKVK